MMKVAYLLGSLNRGGVETLMLDYFRNAEALKFEIMAMYRNDGVLSSQFKQTGIDLFELKPKSKLGTLIYFYRLRKLLLSNKVQIVHAQLPLDALYACIALMGTGLKLILTFHGYDNYNSKLYKLLIRFVAKRTDLNVFVSKVQQSYYQEQYALDVKKQRIVPNGICFDKFQYTAVETLRTAYNMEADILLLGMVGSFLPIRDQLFVCKFLAELHKQAVDFRFLFMGNGSNKDLYQASVDFCSENGLERKVFFLGQRNDVPELLSQLDAFVYASKFDTFGIAIVEAMASGIPVFVNDLPVMKEVTNDGKWADLYATDNVEALMNSFMKFVEDKDTYCVKAKERAEFVREKYSLERHVSCLEEVYSNVLISN